MENFGRKSWFLFVYFSGRGNEKEERESHQLAEHHNLNQRKNNNNKLIAGKIAEGEKSSALTAKQKNPIEKKTAKFNMIELETEVAI